MRVVMTGATSGIGLVAAKMLSGRHAVTIGARSPEVVRQRFGEGTTALPLELGDLHSAARFADAVKKGPPIDRLILNAGLQNVRGGRSVQGLEITFAANHLAHFMILVRLIPHLAKDARVIITSSGTHDPELKTGVPPPRTADARRLAYPERDPDFDIDLTTAGRRAYASSKLCNLMTVRELARRLASERPHVASIAFDPGLTPGTGLARGYPAWQSFIFRNLMGLFVRGEGVSTPSASGACLAKLSDDADYASVRGGYIAVRNRRLLSTPPSTLAQDASACEKLWADSEVLITEVGY